MTDKKILKKVLFFSTLALAVVFLIIGFATWNPLLSLCALGLGIGLTRFLDVVGITTGQTKG